MLTPHINSHIIEISQHKCMHCTYTMCKHIRSKLKFRRFRQCQHKNETLMFAYICIWWRWMIAENIFSAKALFSHHNHANVVKQEGKLVIHTCMKSWTNRCCSNTQIIRFRQNVFFSRMVQQYKSTIFASATAADVLFERKMSKKLLLWLHWMYESIVERGTKGKK